MDDRLLQAEIMAYMPAAITHSHVYQRAVSGDSQDSLSIIASLIEPGQTLLDVGMGTGGLGHYLSQRHAIVADGVTWNRAEADMAAAWYRQVAVADLEQADLCAIFANQHYDCIVCADVLEHIRTPENVLAQCKKLLKPGGRLITSVPNAGYCGLIAELLQGDFRYRQEGLLDNTHLRFFTRLSLQRFFDAQGWKVLGTQTTVRQLSESEFKVAFDSMPPAVARYLLAMPDALTYQFVSVLQPASCAEAVVLMPSGTSSATSAAHSPAVALFSAQVYLEVNGVCSEHDKLLANGQIGAVQQVLGFDIPACGTCYSAIRLDPADRPGFFKLYQLRLRSPDGDVFWQWIAGQNNTALLEQMPHQQILFQQPWQLVDAALLYLYGDDPWMTLPLHAEVLGKLSKFGARLEVLAGWPMSADYLEASTAIRSMQASCERVQIANQDLQCENANISSKLTSIEIKLHEVQRDKLRLREDLYAARLEIQHGLSQHKQLLTHLQTIEQSTVFRVTRPIVNLKMRLDNLLGERGRNLHPNMTLQNLPLLPLPIDPVDIIVPVYRGLDDTRCCIESVLTASCSAIWRLIIINDASPEPAVTEWLRSVAQSDPRIVLLENTENLGFVGTVNRGMAFSADHDVVLLNSDAEVANNWLDRLQQAAYSSPRVATVTPFSNNATICSYPRFCQSNELPTGINTAKLDQLFAHYLAGQTLVIPTGIGFCMYIRRQCLQEVGAFDETNFGKGYGEENDFCVRAQQAGWSNLHALDTFVRHAGGVSFGDSKSTREQQAMATLNRLHPRYETDVHDFVKADPAGTARMLIDMARITSSGKPVILNVTHNREGGTLRHIQELALHLAQQVIFLRLSPVLKGVALNLEGSSEAFELHFEMPQMYSQLVQTLRILQVGHIHYHHLLGHVPGVEDLPAQLGVSHDFTAHDFYSYCPQISLTNHTDRYCGEEGLEQCHQCLERHPAPGGVSIESWRSRHIKLLTNARYLITPSHDAAHRMLRYVPAAHVYVTPHEKLLPAMQPYPQPTSRRLSDVQPLKVAVLGALSKIKGADVLEAVATLAAVSNALVEFHLIGYAYRNLRTQPKAKLTVHGAYDDKDLPKILQWLQPDVVWFPAVWPETYSYTLSACLESGLPVVVPNIGAFAERLQGRSWSWVSDWQQDTATWLAFFETIRTKNFCTATSPAIVQTMFVESQRIEESVDYYGNYLATLPVPTMLASDQLRDLQADVEMLQPTRVHPSRQLKSSALRALIRLRANALMSPMAKWIPTHLQRRVKSWLGA